MSSQKTIPVSRLIKSLLRKIPQGEVFDYTRFNLPPDAESALASVLSRLTAAGKLERLGKGKYFKPRETAFGNLRPSEDEIIKSITIRGNKIKGYLTGLSLYNRLGLTTQVSNTLVIAINNVLPPKKIKGYKIKFSKRQAPITRYNIPLLQLLDAVSDIKLIPDTTVDQAFNILKKRILELETQKKKRLMSLTFYYNPATKALIGALFENYLPGTDVTALKQSINPLTQFKIGISLKLLPNQSNWNIR